MENKLTFVVPYSYRTSALCRCLREICVTPFWWRLFLYYCRSAHFSLSKEFGDPVVHNNSRCLLWRVDNNAFCYRPAMSIDSIILNNHNKRSIYTVQNVVTDASHCHCIYILIVVDIFFLFCFWDFVLLCYNSAVILSSIQIALILRARPMCKVWTVITFCVFSVVVFLFRTRYFDCFVPLNVFLFACLLHSRF